MSFGGVGAVVRRNRDADADAGPRMTRHLRARILDGLLDAAGEDLRVAGAAGLGLDDGELVVADPRQPLRMVDQHEQPFGDEAQERVALRLAAHLVDDAEAVDVDQMERELPARLRASPRARAASVFRNPLPARRDWRSQSRRPDVSTAAFAKPAPRRAGTPRRQSRRAAPTAPTISSSAVFGMQERDACLDAYACPSP